MKMKNTKRSLLLSGISLLLCASMFVGSTFAWFTDTVSSDRNIIQSGNLDVELYYALSAEDVANDKWEKVTAETDVFGYTLWEPGHTRVAYFKVANEGSLALKYQLTADVFQETAGKNKLGENGETFLLSDYLYTEIVDVDATRESILASEKGTKFKGSIPMSEMGKLVAKGKEDATEGTVSEQIIGLAIWMPTSVGNEANHDGKNIPTIEFGINLVATQLTSEEDSFDNQYDVAATWVGIIPATLEDTTLVIEPTLGEQTGTVTVNSPEDLVYLSKLAQEWVSLYSNGEGTNVGSYRESVGGKGTAYYYHWTWDVELTADLDMNNIPMDSVDISYWDNFEGNGHTISNVVLKDGQDGLFINGAKAVNNLTVKNITVNAPEAQTVGAVSGNGAMTNVHVVNANVIGGKYVGGICGKGSSFVNCSIKNSTVTGTDKTVGGLVGYSIGDPNAAIVTGNTVDNVTITGAYNVGGLLGQSQNETVENNTVKNVTVKSILELPGNASANEVRTAELAARSAFDNTTIGSNTVENVTKIEFENVASTDELTAAIAAGGNIALTADVVSKNTTLTIAKDKDVTIDLNGNTLSGVNTAAGTSALIKNSGELTITGNGTITVLAEHPDTDWDPEGFPTYASNTISNSGNLTIGEGIRIENQTAQGGASYAIDNYAGATLTINGGEIIQSGGDVAIRMNTASATAENKVTINGGTISGKRAIWIHLAGSSNATAPKTTLEINGGELSGTQMCIYSYSYGNSFANTNVTINGGTFNGDVQFGGGYKGDSETVTVTGGTFNGEIGRWVTADDFQPLALS